MLFVAIFGKKTMNIRHAVVAGASGLTGMHLTQMLLAGDLYSKVTLLVRKPIDLQHPKLEQVITDFDRLNNLPLYAPPVDLYCALGTTIRTAGSQEAFRKVDLVYVQNLLGWGESAHVKRFMVVSAMGANKASRIFYNRIKGEMEASVCQSAIPEKHIFRPSLLLGRRSEKRSAEKAAQMIMGVLSFAFSGPLLKYKAIEASAVAAAMIASARDERPGCTIHMSDEIQQFAHS